MGNRNYHVTSLTPSLTFDSLFIHWSAGW
jgi:hypothetical protein